MSPKLTRAYLIPLLSLVFCLLSFKPALAEIGPGDLIKLPDDGDLETTTDSAVYYHGSDGKRYAFPNSQSYFTWYADFNGVKIVTASELAALQLGGNIIYRPGTRLVKITSDPNVYAVEPGGTLRWVQSEAVASALFGPEWNKRIDDVPDAFFVNYSIGEPLAAAVYPDGTVVKRTTDNALFLIEDRNKRKIASAAVKTALRIQDQFVLSTASTLADYPDGPDIIAAEPAITDTAQKSLLSLPSVPTFTARIPATAYFAVGGDATLLELHIASLKAVTINRLTVKLDATTNNPADANVIDDDKGGLVYQNNAQPNFTLIRFKDQLGNEPFGRKDIALDVVRDQSQTFVFDGSFSIPEATEKVLYFTAKTNTLLPTGEGYKVTLVVSGTNVVDGSTGAPTTFAPGSDLVGPTLLSLNASMEVTTSATPGNKTFVRGATNVEIAGLGFKATTVAPNVINTLTVQGYIDEEGTAGFLPGADADNGSETRVRDMVPAVSLYDSAGVKLAGPVAVTLEGKATFSGLTYHIAAGQTASLIIKGDIPKTLDVENAPNKVTFDVTDASVDVAATDDKGTKINVKGLLPNGGTTPTFYTTVKKNGTAAWSWAGNGGNAIAGRETLIGTLSVDAKDDAYELKTVSFVQVGAAAQSLGDARLEYPVTSTTSASVTVPFIGNGVTFSNLPTVLEKDKITAIKLYVKIDPREAGAVNGEQIKIKLDDLGALQFVSKSNGDSYDAEALPSVDFTLPANTTSSAAVRFTGLTLAKDAASPVGIVFRNSTTEVFRFTAKTETEGAARIKKMTFKLTPADVGQVGADNDSIERWADVNGDFTDDDGIVNLKLISGSTQTILGEDSTTRIMLSLVQGGVKKTEPSTLSTGVGDHGLLEYVFDDNNELFVPAGTTLTLSLEMDTSKFNTAQNFGFGVDLLGLGDFQWTDIPSGAYTPLAGGDAFGLPLTTSVTVQK